MSTPQSYYVPFVIEKTGRGERQYDIYSRLLEDRIVFIGTPIDDNVANSVIAQLLYLQKENKNQEISLFLNTPGGSVTAGLAIYDTMQYVKPDVSTICIGQAASMASLLMTAGARGRTIDTCHVSWLPSCAAVSPPSPRNASPACATCSLPWSESIGHITRHVEGCGV